jgi:hypothetical protein
MFACLVKNQTFDPEVKTSIHVVDHTIKPILLYGCEIWGYFNPFTSRLEMEIFQ